MLLYLGPFTKNEVRILEPASMLTVLKKTYRELKPVTNKPGNNTDKSLIDV